MDADSCWKAHEPTGAAGPAVLVRLPLLVALGLAALVIPYVSAHFVDAALNNLSEGRHGWLLALAPGFLGLYVLLGGLRWSAILVFSYLGFSHSTRPRRANLSEWPRVSILVPCYNEEATVEPMMHSLLGLDYPNFEILVVDDGSTDKTYEKAARFAGHYDHCRVRVYRKPNGGKWSAHNFLFHRSSSELLLCVDADSRLSRDALRRLVPHMTDPNVGAVAGYVRIRNRENVLTRLQALEYLWASALRLAQGHTGNVLVVAGPLGLFRRSVLEDVYLRFGAHQRTNGRAQMTGPYEGSTFAEDFDLSMAILSLGNRIVYEPTAISHTTCPSSVFTLLNQRYRWYRGSLQTLLKYIRRARAQSDLRRARLIGWLLATYAMDLIAVPVYVVMLLVLFTYLGAGGNACLILQGFLAYLAVNLNTQAHIVSMHRDNLKLLAFVPLYDFYQGLLLNNALIVAAFDQIRGKAMRW